MGRVAIRQAIYSDLMARQDLLDLLGPVSDLNKRVYAAYPQEIPRLSGNASAEGWLIFYEEQSVIPWETILESSYYDFHCWCLSLTIGEAVIDILDELYHWRVAGQNSRTFDNYNVIDMRRVHCLETYDDEVKLYRKIGRYRFSLVKTPFSS